MPRVSVIVPAFNEPEYLAEALASVLAQTEGDFELIVVDDGSSRDLSEAMEPCYVLGDRFRCVRQDNAGGAAARNRGVADARGEWIAFLDHDDRWLPEKLARQLVAVDGSEAGMVFCQFRSFGATEEAYPEWSTSVRLEDLLRHTLIRTMSVVMIRKSAVPEGDWFRRDLSMASDIELYYRIAERAEIRFVPEVLVEKRAHDRNATRDSLRMHQEGVQVADELEARVGAGLAPETFQLLRDRTCRHLIGSAEAARRAGDRRLSRAYYRRVIGMQPGRVRALCGYLSTWVR